MTPDEQEQRRKAEVESAWATLAHTRAFQTVLEDAQLRFGMFKPSFQAVDGYNPHAAAQRDGNKEVLADFAKKIARHGALITNSQDQTP